MCRNKLQRSGPGIGGLTADRRAAMALEFALVSMAFVMLVVGMLQVGFCLYAKVVLDQSAAAMSRQLQTGTAKANAAAGITTFASVTVCGALQGLLDCGLVAVTLYPVPDYQTGGGSVPFDPGVSKSLMLLTVTYTSPLPTWPLQVGSGATPLRFTASVPVSAQPG